ncbi:MAG: DUF1800 domain-containing protein [Polaromonas sp.]|nr:DUF1800 domain-containing protein [Gemmatimonadaceae bacterium]
MLTPLVVVSPSEPREQTADQQVQQVLNRMAFGPRPGDVAKVRALGVDQWIALQLAPDRIDDGAADRIVASYEMLGRPTSELVAMYDNGQQAIRQQQKQQAQQGDTSGKKDLRAEILQANPQLREQLRQNQRILGDLQSAKLARAVISDRQLAEVMTDFWENHFSVYAGKGLDRIFLPAYDRDVIRPNSLGKFRDLLGAVARHPAMLRFLDNEQNAANRINENYARELMELHTLGQGAGYSQQDVQEMARVLTGVGVNLGTDNPKVRNDLQRDYVRAGLFEFNPNRHDYGAKTLLGQPIRSRGLAELDEALDRLAKHPATAHFISRKLAQYWLSDDPPPALVERMAQSFLKSEGDIAVTLQTLLASPEYAQGAGQKFKDPVHYVVSAVRLAYDDKPILNVGPMLNWLNRMGEPLYGRQTPDGYALDTAAWSSPGQMATRFEIAKAIGSGNAGLFKTDGPQPLEKPAFPQLANALYYRALGQTLGPNTQQALAQATSAQEWNSFLLSSPELMHR